MSVAVEQCFYGRGAITKGRSVAQESIPGAIFNTDCPQCHKELTVINSPNGTRILEAREPCGNQELGKLTYN